MDNQFLNFLNMIFDFMIFQDTYKIFFWTAQNVQQSKYLNSYPHCITFVSWLLPMFNTFHVVKLMKYTEVLLSDQRYI